jgi:hypothetical protein
VKAGSQKPNGSFEKGSVNQRVREQLKSLATGLRDFMRTDDRETKSEGPAQEEVPVVEAQETDDLP